MKTSQNQKLDDIKRQIKDQLDCVIKEMKSEMEHMMAINHLGRFTRNSSK